MERPIDPALAQYAAERSRIEQRRKILGLPAGRPWGLALSGGGIRSATFCLGVLQSMARAPAPGEPLPDSAQEGLLARFDYLSTVSGGGYIGSFFSSLFIPGRLRGVLAGESETEQARALARQAARDAYEALRFEPPGRISTGIDYFTEPPGMAPSAWLRENGRYLTPTGSGDMFYAAAMTWRNWMALHMVIGLPLLAVLAVLVTLDIALGARFYLLPLLALLGYALPCALGYWLIVGPRSLDDPPKLNNPAFNYALVGALVLLACSVAAECLSNRSLALLCGAGAAVAAAALVTAAWVTATLRRPGQPLQGNTVRNYRVVITRHLSHAMITLVIAASLVLMVSLSRTLYDWLSVSVAGTGAGGLAVLVWIVRKLALLQDEKQLPAWAHKLPLDILGLIAGTVMALVTCLVWALVTWWVAADGGALGAAPGAWLRLSGLALFAGIATLITGQFSGFLNSSSLQSFYASRLTRAYLGASNGQRFDGDAGQRRRSMSVAEPLASDDLSLAQFYGTRTAGPLHLINVTMNLTVDPAEQLVQRDRKGKPLCLAPNWYPSGNATPSESFILDGLPYARGPHRGRPTEMDHDLSLGQWVGVSGAAFSTGLGRTTSLGFSLVLGLANVRLGYWWPSNFSEPGRPDWAPREPWLARLLPAQTYLFYELTAHFHGHRRNYQYLSDGGHFENTAAYELVRPGRDLALVVIADCGCDPDYRFDDLANLVRLARIDHSLEIREDLGVQSIESLRGLFGSIESFAAPASPDNGQCALLLNAYAAHQPAEAGGAPICRILLIKPRITAGLAPDVMNYARDNPTFPNQSTVDQFFDEAQFESYRQLGLHAGQAIFGSNEGNLALWRYLGLDGQTAPPQGR
ncbi:hypothetical protein [Pseudomonas sp. dw_358]|uniref:hypothetical protein n=1 Tax=Pseudomonas sp. dw_358 TaxID=2720083 RepID=UPI001BD45AED|nr:hypothetical protein [Pseudomonas sp. dw_358]